jgi:hypothetical protein
MEDANDVGLYLYLDGADHLLRVEKRIDEILYQAPKGAHQVTLREARASSMAFPTARLEGSELRRPPARIDLAKEVLDQGWAKLDQQDRVPIRSLLQRRLRFLELIHTRFDKVPRMPGAIPEDADQALKDGEELRNLLRKFKGHEMARDFLGDHPSLQDEPAQQ